MELNDEYKIGINIQVNKSSLEIMTQFNKLVSELTAKFNTLTESLAKFNTDLAETNGIFSRLDAFMTTFGTSAVKNISMATKEVETLNRAMTETGALTAGGTIGGGRGGKRGGFGEEAARHLGRESFGTMGALISRVMAPEIMIPAMAVGFLGKSSFDTAKRIQGLEARINVAGYGTGLGQQVYQQAMQSNLKGVSPEVYLESYSDALTITKNAKQASLMAPAIAQMVTANKILYQGRFSNHDMQLLLRATEIKTGGAPTAARLLPTLNDIEKMYTMEGGGLRSQDVVGFMQRFASFAPEMSEQSFFALLPLMQSLRGSSVGSTLRMGASQLLRGQNFKTGKQAVERLERMGIMTKERTASDPELLQQNPVMWLNKVVLPAYQKAGIKGQPAILRELMKDFTGTLPNVFGQIVENEQKIINTLAQSKVAMGFGSAYNLSMQTLGGQQQGLGASWQKFAAALSKITSPLITAGIGALTGVLEALAAVLNFIAGGPLANLLNKGASKINPAWLKTKITNLNQIPSLNVYLDGEKITNSVHAHTNKQANAPLGVTSILGNLSFFNPALGTPNGSSF